MDNKTCTNNVAKPLDIKILLEAVEELSEPPKVIAMNFNYLFSEYLPKNTIIISSDLADRLEAANA